MTLSDYVWLPIEFANSGGSVSSISLLDNGAPVPNATLTPPFYYPIGFEFDTLMVSNGVHNLSVSAEWNDVNGGRWEAESDPVSVITSNEVTFENWMPLYGEFEDSLLIRATSAHPDTYWWIDVYSIRTNYYHYIGTFSGYTDNGDIAATWNLVGPHGESYSAEEGFAFEVSTEYIDPPTPPTYRVKDPWPEKGAWAAACQHAWDDGYDEESMYNELRGFVGVAVKMGCQILPSTDSENNLYTLHITDPSDPQGNAEWSAFRSAIYNPATRNLVYFGHGGQTGIGKNPANTNRFITATEIGNILHTIPAGQANRHAFRFVFIDACATTEGSLPEAFGIFHKENVPITDYNDASLRPSAYVGWPKDKAIALTDRNSPNYYHICFMQHIQTEMTLNGRGIKEAIIRASHSSDVGAWFGENDLKVFGYWGLTVGGYNR